LSDKVKIPARLIEIVGKINKRKETSIINANFLLEKTMRKPQLGFLLMAISAIGLGVGTILMKLLPLRTDMTPGHVAVWRFLVAAPLMWVITLSRKRKSGLVPEHPWWLIGLGAIYSLASLFALLALDRLPSSIYAILVYIYPSLVVIYSMVVKKPVPQLWWLGLPMTLIGLALTVFRFGQPLEFDMVGILISLLNGVTIAVYMLLSEAIFKHVKARQLGTTWVNTGAMIMGVLMISIFGFNAPDTFNGWVLLLSLGIFGTLIPILFMNIGIQLLGAARSSVIVTLQPVVAVLISTIFLGDVLTVSQWIGGALVIIAIALLQRNSNQTSSADTIK
jgi:drug/metabolite transporter (DMT)-like permease